MKYYHLFWIIPLTLIIGMGLMYWFMLYTLKKATGFKSWKEFLEQFKKARELQKKMKKGDINSLMQDPEFRKQMEEMRKKFGGL